LERFLDRPDIELACSGLPNARVRLMMRGEVAAANVFGAQYYILEQLGFRKLVDTTFIMGFLIKEDADSEDTERYFRGLRRAQQAIDLEPERYKDYWLRELPEDLAKGVDVRRFGPGERIVFEHYTREMYESTHRWMKSWDMLELNLEDGAGFEKAVLV
jgi:NitT/TauT family transport system substrate-binding protein